jgi:hypothetical protein
VPGPDPAQHADRYLKRTTTGARSTVPSRMVAATLCSTDTSCTGETFSHVIFRSSLPMPRRLLLTGHRGRCLAPQDRPWASAAGGDPGSEAIASSLVMAQLASSCSPSWDGVPGCAVKATRARPRVEVTSRAS